MSISSIHCLRPIFAASMMSACRMELAAATALAVATVTPLVARTNSSGLTGFVTSSGL